MLHKAEHNALFSDSIDGNHDLAMDFSVYIRNSTIIRFRATI